MKYISDRHITSTEYEQRGRKSGDLGSPPYCYSNSVRARSAAQGCITSK